MTCLVRCPDPVKVSFFGDLGLASVSLPQQIEGPHIKIASLVDLGATKVAVIQKRASLKDYLDIDALLNQGELDLETLIAAGSIVYGTQFNPQLTFKALTYFKGGDLESLPLEIQKRLIMSLKNIKEEKIQKRLLELQHQKNHQ
ncbi:MAG: hypothetical protein B7Y25_01905 [Alphaproteobacteria bacterium 16-39-46]|nr:MAG: hypothetical protein B7Y25_01905 [Alphaproteobacteria bacterium 16-39-46]OZA43910.1 MAG: hypothetical protein B7X84_01925 [Alphaproteobacteria bacterium 17-39-52]HQS83702.1 hypothetical protein [Alphaproteobacteria bacterium]HQS93470.1 hypothetical protein [Alphaproteobacteria bacterium]